MRLFIASVQASYARDHGGNFVVPAEKQLHHHRRVHAVLEQMPTASRRFLDRLS
jgi:hypothetical protein